MKALKVVGVVFGSAVGLIAVASAVFYFGWLSPASPEAICDNVGRIFKAESGAEFPKELKTECERKAGKAPEFGRATWVATGKCMRDAKNKAELSDCGKR